MQVENKYLAIFAITVGASLLFSPPSSMAADPQQSTPISSSPSSKDSTQTSTKATIRRQPSPSEEATNMVKEARESLKEQREQLEKQADRHFQSLEAVLGHATKVVLGLVAIFAALFVYMFGRTRDELKATIKDLFNKETKGEIEAHMKELREKVSSVSSDVERLRNQYSAPVTWIKPSQPNENSTREELARYEQRENSEQKLLEMLSALGISKISFSIPHEDGNLDSVDQLERSLVILSFDASASAKRTLDLVSEHLKRLSTPPFLLIYTYLPDRMSASISEDDKEALKGFDWYVPVNFPAQLATQALALLRRADDVSRERING